MNRLYVIVPSDLTQGQKTAQSVHAVAQYMLEHSNWKNEYIVCLESGSMETIKAKMDFIGIDYSEFREPSMDRRLTGIAVLNQDKFLSKLNLIGE